MATSCCFFTSSKPRMVWLGLGLGLGIGIGLGLGQGLGLGFSTTYPDPNPNPKPKTFGLLKWKRSYMPMDGSAALSVAMSKAKVIVSQ